MHSCAAGKRRLQGRNFRPTEKKPCQTALGPKQHAEQSGRNVRNWETDQKELMASSILICGNALVTGNNKEDLKRKRKEEGPAEKIRAKVGLAEPRKKSCNHHRTQLLGSPRPGSSKPRETGSPWGENPSAREWTLREDQQEWFDEAPTAEGFP